MERDRLGWVSKEVDPAVPRAHKDLGPHEFHGQGRVCGHDARICHPRDDAAHERHQEDGEGVCNFAPVRNRLDAVPPTQKVVAHKGPDLGVRHLQGTHPDPDAAEGAEEVIADLVCEAPIVLLEVQKAVRDANKDPHQRVHDFGRTRPQQHVVENLEDPVAGEGKGECG